MSADIKSSPHPCDVHEYLQLETEAVFGDVLCSLQINAPLLLSIDGGGGNQRLVSEGTAITQGEYLGERLGVLCEGGFGCVIRRLGSVRRLRGGMTAFWERGMSIEFDVANRFQRNKGDERLSL